MGSALAFGPDDPECYEDSDCDFFLAPLDAMLEPYVTVFGDFVYLLIWGIIIFILWLRTSNTMLVSIIGLALAIFLTTSVLPEDTLLVGYVLIAVAGAVALYQILTVRTHFPSN